MKKIDTVVFDMDGTLLDTLGDITDSVNYIMDRYGFPTKTVQDVKRFVGNGAARLIELSVPKGMDNPQYYRCLHEFTDYYKQNMQKKTFPFPEVPALLNRLCQNDYKLAIVSNKFDPAVRELNQRYFGKYIKVAIGESDRVKKKPAPDSVFNALKLLKSSVSRTVYLGDSEVDIETARNAGVTSIGVSWGNRDGQFLLNEGADYIINMPMELLDLLEIINQK
jgi:phosphoglycolate phosphatase